MQINPTSQSASAFGAFFGGDSNQGGGFYDVMQEAITSVEDGDNVSVSSAMDESNAPRVESPYSRHTTDGVTYTLSEVCFTKNELAELREQLLREGAPEETLRQFDILAGQPDGATLAQVMASLMGKTGQVSLDDKDTQAITALLNQIDASDTLAGDALGFMLQGNGEAAFGLIRNALGKMAADQRIDIDPATLNALGRGLGLNQATMNMMAANLGGGSLSLSGEQFGLLLDPARSQFISDAANAQKLDAALEKTLKQLIARARSRMEKEQEASARESRRVQQSRILIDRTVQKESREILDETVAGSQGARSSGAVGKAGADRADAAQTDPRSQKIDNRNRQTVGQMLDGNEIGAAENAKQAANAQFASNTDKHDLKDGDGKGSQNAWQDMLGRVEAKPAQPNSGLNASSFVYSMLQGSQPAQAAQPAPMNMAPGQPLPQLAQQAASQVENGILTAMRDGSTRLDLQLHPAELGPLSITLIARNGEVTARLRSERTETAEILTRQLDMIRVNLEEQGVKVDKIEVQLQNQQDNSQNAFADLDQHNARQQEEARRQTMNRLRNLANLRAGDESALAQGLHDVGQTANLAASGLHVVA